MGRRTLWMPEPTLVLRVGLASITQRTEGSLVPFTDQSRSEVRVLRNGDFLRGPLDHGHTTTTACDCTSEGQSWAKPL